MAEGAVVVGAAVLRVEADGGGVVVDGGRELALEEASYSEGRAFSGMGSVLGR